MNLCCFVDIVCKTELIHPHRSIVSKNKIIISINRFATGHLGALSIIAFGTPPQKNSEIRSRNRYALVRFDDPDFHCKISLILWLA